MEYVINGYKVNIDPPIEDIVNQIGFDEEFTGSLAPQTTQEIEEAILADINNVRQVYGINPEEATIEVIAGNYLFPENTNRRMTVSIPGTRAVYKVVGRNII